MAKKQKPQLMWAITRSDGTISTAGFYPSRQDARIWHRFAVEQKTPVGRVVRVSVSIVGKG